MGGGSWWAWFSCVAAKRQKLTAVASCDRVTVRHKRVKTAPYFHDELCVER